MKQMKKISNILLAKRDGNLNKSKDKQQAIITYEHCLTEDETILGSLNRGEISSNTINRDEGYAWLIVLWSFMAHVFIGGIVLTTGVTYVIFLDAFKASAGVTAWAGTLPRASISFIAPVSSMLTNKYGSRPVVILGGVISAIGLGTSAFATSIYHMYITYGIITGAGLGIAYIPATTIINEYFKEKKSIAFGLATSGFGVGTFIYPQLIEVLNEKYGWRGVMIVLSAIGLNMCVCGALMRPFRQIDVMKNRSLFNPGILKSMNFLFLCVNSFVYHFGISIVLTHLSEYSILVGIKGNESAMLFSVLGIANIIGLLLLGAIGHHHKANGMVLYAAGLFICGITTVFVPLLTQYGPLLTYSGLVGFCSATVTVLSPGIVCKILGPTELSNGYGVLLPTAAVGLLLGGPVAGFMYDSLHSYNSSFFVGGGTITASALCMIIPYLREKHNHSANTLTDETDSPIS